MGWPVNTVVTGGLAVVESTNGFGTPVSEAAAGRGVAVTKIVGGLGLPVIFETIGIAAPVTYVTWDAATVTAVTLSGGNLVATNTGTTSADQGARVASTAGKTAGKYYFEVTFTTQSGNNYCTGIGTTTSTYTNIGGTSTTGVFLYNSGNVWTNNTNTGIAFGALTGGNTVRIAVDLDNRKIWFKVSGAGNWNNSGPANPSTNVGGVVVPAGTMVPFCVFGGTGGTAGRVQTANFGATAFASAVPAGFTSGWLV